MTPSQIRLAVLSSQYLSEDQKASRRSVHLQLLQSSLTLDEIEHGIVERAYLLDCFPVSGSGKLIVERVNGLYQLGSIGRPFRLQLVRTLIDLIGDGCDGCDQDMAQRRLADEDLGNGLLFYGEPLRVSFARWSNGDLKTPREINKLARNGAALSLGFRSTILAGDAEGVKHLLENSKIAKRYGDKLHALFKDLHISTENPCFALLCEPSVDYCGYISSLLKMFSAGSGAQWRLLYRKEHSEKVGHEILVAAHAMSAKPSSDGDSFMPMLSAVIRDGADWYMAHRQITTGHYAYLDLINREKQSFKELAEVIDKVSLRNKVPDYIRAILRAQPPDALIGAATNRTRAEKIHRIVPLDELLPLLGPGSKRQHLSADIGL